MRLLQLFFLIPILAFSVGCGGGNLSEEEVKEAEQQMDTEMDQMSEELPADI
ncbi:MAG: hypothetical protein KDA80_15900 [Planctomycetaceae bacterium]|nr:hypothetical protein [Planctomycetaceae bacterium]